MHKQFYEKRIFQPETITRSYVPYQKPPSKFSEAADIVANGLCAVLVLATIYGFIWCASIACVVVGGSVPACGL